jgi:hypothetical protein
MNVLFNMRLTKIIEEERNAAVRLGTCGKRKPLDGEDFDVGHQSYQNEEIDFSKKLREGCTSLAIRAPAKLPARYPTLRSSLVSGASPQTITRIFRGLALMAGC